MATVPQETYKDDQDLSNIDFDQIYSSFISSIDALRSHFNALEQNSQELNTPDYQESRCHAFYRMIGFPIVAPDGKTFYSPGFNPNANINQDTLNKYKQINDKIENNISLTNQFFSREQIPRDYNKIFSDGGDISQAVAIGSIFIREFDKQIGDTDPLVLDTSSTQNIDERYTEINGYFNNTLSGEVLDFVGKSNHQLKPFVVDPRIDSSIRPIKNKICAPFLKDKSQTKIFQSSTGSFESLKRPFIERVISVRFNNRNVMNNTDPAFLNNLLQDVSDSTAFIDKDLSDTLANPLKQLYSSELTVFNNYYKIIKKLVESLVDSIRGVQYIRERINFNPIPDPKRGIESGTNGGKLSALVANDNNNKELDKNILFQTLQKYLNDTTFDAGLQGVPDPGDFVFSNLEDSVFAINKNMQKFYDENIKKATSIRDKAGATGIDLLKNIEIIMGDCSGIGVIDMVAIQAALWIMPANSLLGLIDVEAFVRIADHREDINIDDITANDVLSSLKDFEKTLKIIYSLIQDYYIGLNTGKVFTV